MPFCRVAVPKAVSAWQFDFSAQVVSQDFSREKRLLIPDNSKRSSTPQPARSQGKTCCSLPARTVWITPAWGFVIGKKSVKLSVQRNRLKRLMRDSFRLNQHLLAGWDIVIVARKGLGEIENPELHQHFGKLWKRLARSRPAPVVNTDSVGVDSKNDA